MLRVKNLSDVQMLIREKFAGVQMPAELIMLDEALNRVLAEDVACTEYIPAFDRSTVDGYALKGSDVFGCSDAMPAILKMVGEVLMGKHTEIILQAGQCVSVPTGGEIPQGADAVVMLEDTEDFGDGTIGVRKPCAPGANLIFRGDDGKPGDGIYKKGKRIHAVDVGTLAALGLTLLPVRKKPRVVIISSGDELVNADDPLTLGTVRDVNGPMLKAAALEYGASARFYGIVKDDQLSLEHAVRQAIRDCDILVLSGGTSAGVKDSIPETIAKLGDLYVHGVAVKPGKPTIFGQIETIPVFGLPGNPVAAYFMFLLLVKPLLDSMLGAEPDEKQNVFSLACAVSSNQGREDIVPVIIEGEQAYPIIGKSGLITTLAGAHGYFRIARDREGLKKGEPVEVILFKE